jgi:hypothetical protein
MENKRLKMKENETFKVGDLVKLKSGGPVMTINLIKDYDENECVCPSLAQD